MRDVKKTGIKTIQESSSAKMGSWRAERHASALSGTDRGPSQQKEVGSPGSPHQQGPIKWNQYNARLTETLPEPASSGRLIQSVRQARDRHKLETAGELNMQRQNYDFQIGWGQFEDRPRKQVRLAWMNRHFDQAQSAIEQNKRYLGDNALKSYLRLIKEAESYKKASLEEHEGYSTEGNYKHRIEQLMGMARQLEEHVEWTKWSEKVDREKVRITASIDPRILATRSETERDTYDKLVAEGQREVERFRRAKEGRREEGIAEPYITDIQVAFGLVADSQWGNAIKEAGQDIKRTKREVDDSLFICKGFGGIDSSKYMEIDKWIDKGIRDSLSILTDDRGNITESRIIKEFSRENGNRAYSNLREIAAKFKKMRNILESYVQESIDIKVAQEAIDTLIRPR